MVIFKVESVWKEVYGVASFHKGKEREEGTYLATESDNDALLKIL